MKKEVSGLNGLQRICVVLLVLGQLPIGALAQPAPSTTSPSSADLRGRTVEAVRILGNQTVSTAVILNVVRTREGDRLDPETVQDDYKRVFDLNKFSNVESKFELTPAGGVIVIFVVSEQSQLREVMYRGNVAIDTPTLQGAVDIKINESINPFRLAVARRTIETLYKERNYPLAHVEIDQQALAKGEAVFNIVEGPNVRIRKINFVGAKSFSESRLKGAIESKSWIWIFRHGTFSPETVDDDVGALRRYYEQKGFFDARVGRKLIWSPDMTELQIDFVIEEGVRYTIEKVTFKGNENVTDAQLRKNLKLVEGLPYDNEVLQRDVREMVRVYSPLGFIYLPQATDSTYLTIDPQPVFRREAGRVELVYQISEGKPYRIGNIVMRGNSKTQDKVILRELQFAPGQLYNSGAVADAVERLRGTPFFTRVTATPFGDDPNSRDLLVEVEENRTATFSIGAGINSNGGIGGNITYEQRNFDITNWPSSWRELFSDRAFTGAGQTFRLSFEPGTTITNASLRFTEPWIFDQPYSFTGELYLRQRVREDYDDQRMGGRLSLGKRFNTVWSGAITLRAETVEISNIEDKEVRAEEILDEEGEHFLSSVALRLTRDTTTRGLLPDRGSTTAFGVEVFGAMAGDYSFQRFTLSHDQYFTLHEDLMDRKVILALHGDAGLITGESPFFERFYGGGIGSVRGFAFRGISPRSGPEDDRIGGDFMMTGSAEVSFPIAGEELRGVVFADVGTVEPDFEFGTIRSSVGAGVRLTLPFLGRTPIALDLAIPLTKDGDDDTQFISFSFGFMQ